MDTVVKEGMAPGDPGMSTQEAASAFTDILMGEQPESDQSTTDETQIDEDLELQQAEADDEVETEEVDTEEVDTEDDFDGEYFEIEGEQYSAQQLLDWKESGMLKADYTQKTQAVAEERKQVKAQLEQFSELNTQMLQHIEQNGNVLLQQLEADGYTQENLNRLREQDFDEYLRHKDIYEERMKGIQGLVQQHQVLQQQQEQAQAQLHQEKVQAAYQVISENIPDYVDDDKGPEIRKGVSALMNEFGYTAEDLDTIVDGRMFVLAHALYEARGGQPPEVRKAIAKKKVARKVAPVIKGGQQKTKSQRQSKTVKDLKNKAIQSGSQRDAAAAFEALFND